MLFVALGASIRSCLYGLRPLLIMNGAHLKGSNADDVAKRWTRVAVDGGQLWLVVEVGGGRRERMNKW
ncbi:hypothetical protein L6452_06404 [Arctium lappa]|uniref:Uncharacterized protein n=1 Tax=Arctium lappa TaxID=4217 RepID=A0ACB9EK42_ARCLA|nr:hypothetical protein L6452_06404 [Arctium lappa]